MMPDFRLLSARRSAKVVGSGLIALDVIHWADGDETWAAAGGSCGNVLTILSWLGWQSFPIARLGKDAAADFICDDLQAFGVNAGEVRNDPSVETPIVIQRNRRGPRGTSHRFLLVCPECGSWLPRFRSIILGQAAESIHVTDASSLFYFDRVSPGILQLAQRARASGAVIMFEPSSVGDERQFCRAVDLCDILKYSGERLGHVADLTATKFPTLIVETRSADGLRFRWKDRWFELDPFVVPVLEDAAGAGDWCSAGLAHALCLKGRTGLLKTSRDAIAEGLNLGQALASLNCQFLGARGLMYCLTRQRVDKELRKLSSQCKSVKELNINNGLNTDVRIDAVCNTCVGSGVDKHGENRKSRARSG